MISVEVILAGIFDEKYMAKYWLSGSEKTGVLHFSDKTDFLPEEY